MCSLAIRSVYRDGDAPPTGIVNRATRSTADSVHHRRCTSLATSIHGDVGGFLQLACLEKIDGSMTSLGVPAGSFLIARGRRLRLGRPSLHFLRLP
jgi:hypothetical protein